MFLSRLVGISAALFLSLLTGAAAQMYPPGNVPGGPPPGVYVPPPPGNESGGGTNPICVRLETALAQLDAPASAGSDGGRRYEDAIARQKFELDQTIMQGRRAGCDSGGFFIFFAPRSPQCEQINDQITRARSNLDRMTADLSRTHGGGLDVNRDLQRRQLLASLQQNNCGAQYRNSAPQQQVRSRSWLENLFGGLREESEINATPLDLPSSSTFRTLCVRTCDGFYFPVSYATVPSRFGEDEQTCKRLCPAAEAELYTHRNPGEQVDRATSITGRLYSELPTAFKYRQEYIPSCSCRAAGQSWADALGVGKDQTVQQGDIIVTEERAKQMAQPKQPNPPKGGAASQPVTSQLPPGAEQEPQTQNTTEGTRKVRTVGPEFYPVR